MSKSALRAEDAIGKFVSLIKRQAILSRPPLVDGCKPDIEHVFETVSCHNNTDLFVASMNCVRHSRINDLSTNYSLLNLDNDFMVRSLVLNSLGTLLAVVGDAKVVIIALPPFYNRNCDKSFVYCSKSYLAGIQKVLWHPASHRDRTLVVLTKDSRLFSVEPTLNTSSEVQVDLLQKGILAESISFGNPETLTGSLTLYVADKASNVYAIFPFVRSQSQILVTEEQVDCALQEARNIMEWNESQFLYPGIVDSFNSALQRRLIFHYNYLEHLKSQFRSGSLSTLEADVRVDSKGTARFFSNVKVLENPGPLHVQGPLFRLADEMALTDITYFYPNENAGFLAIIAKSCTGAIHMRYFVQANPLLMLWYIPAELKLTEQPLLTSAGTESGDPKAYRLPRRGFGFVDAACDSKSLVVRKKETEKQRIRDLAIRERKFIETNYETLSFIKQDKILTKSSNPDTSRIHVFGSSMEKLSILVNNTVLLFNVSDMAQSCLNTMNSGMEMGELPSPNVSTPLVCDDIALLIYLNDCVGDTGDYLVYSKATGLNCAEVVHVSEKEKRSIRETVTPEGVADEFEDVDQDELIRKLEELVKAGDANFGEQSNELQQQLRYLSALKITAGEYEVVRGKVLGSSIESLEAVEALSRSTAQHISAFTGFAIKLQLKLTSQLVLFKSEISALSCLLESQPGSKKIKEYQDRIKRLAQRLEATSAKIAALQTKLRDYIYKLNAEKPLPLSLAEKSWFKEINAISEHLKTDTAKRPSLGTEVQSLQDQAKLVISDLSALGNSAKTASAAETLKNMELRGQLIRFAAKLHDEEKVIRLVKLKLGHCFDALKISG